MPECGIAYWGIGLSLLLNPHVPDAREESSTVRCGDRKGKALVAKTQRERDYIDALGVMYADFDKVDHRTRVVAYAKAMEQLAQRYPDDDEAQIHYALSLSTSASPADKTYANQLKGAAILEPIAKRQPQHPGVAHYLIHLYDYPPIAEKAVGCGAALRQDRPCSCACLSTCRHTSSRASAIGASRSPRISKRRVSLRSTTRGTINCTQWTTWSMPICSSARDTKAKAVIDEMIKVTGFSETFIAGPYALAISPAALRDRARRLEGSGGITGPAHPARSCEAITHFARALGAARSAIPRLP